MTAPRYLICASILLAGAVRAQVGCALPGLEAVSPEHPECLFFTGTKQYREKAYAKAMANWLRLSRLPALEPDQEHLRTDAQNNLGFLYYMGLGTTASRETALQYWRTAYAAGHEESAYHLCHYFGSAREPEYQPDLATTYCREALRRYADSRGPDEQTSEVIAQVQRILAGLPKR